MSFLGWFGSKSSAATDPAKNMVIYTADITNPEQHSVAADLITLLESPNGGPLPRYNSIKTSLTTDDIDRAKALIKRDMVGSAIGGIDNAPQLRGQDGLDRVEKLKAAYFRPAITKQGDRALITTTRVDAFWSAEIQQIAKAIAEKYGNIPGVIDIGSLQQAQTLLKEKGAVGITKEIPALKDVPNFATNIERLVQFMERGNNGIANHGPFNIGGREYGPVFKLAKLPQYTLTGDAPEGSRLESLERMLKEFEADFKETGFDRIYIDGGDGNLYLGIRSDGPITDVGRRATGTFKQRSLDEPSALGLASDSHALTRNSGIPAKLGTVLLVVDEPNNRREAATQSFRTMVLNTVRTQRENAQKGLPPLYVSSSIGPPGIYNPATGAGPSGGALSGWGRLLGFTAVGAAGGGVIGGFESLHGIAIAGAIAAGTVAGTVGTAVIGYMTERALTPQTIVPFLYAAGITTNSTDLRAEQF